ncbi:MAG: formylmethanofuran dehydrogenase subunit A [Gammaproteobacteria bacterium]|nr:formylmethanofuran dehydrogenase subunit A [Gammaproteobacteria bacterium]
MLTKITGGTIFDPANGIDGEVRDLFIRDDHVIETPPDDVKIDTTIDAKGKTIMAGAIDLHTHIGGGKVNVARTMMTDDHRQRVDHRTDLKRAGSGIATPSTTSAGYRYGEMGYTACFEPAVLPNNARQAHMEMADTPMVDTGGYALLGNDDFLLRMMAEDAEQSLINDYVAWTLTATQCIGIKVVNPGGINAFKFNTRKLDVDEPNPHYGVTARDIVRVLSRALSELGVPHPLHIHCSNLGIPGNYESTLQTIAAAESHPIHLTHVQFHSYGTDGPYSFSSEAARIAEAINSNRGVTTDVGQIMFGQTVTCSGDTMLQYRHRHHASPRKWTCMDIECDAGCGVVPFRYRNKQFVNALQWAIGLETFLMIEDPWRVFLTTDHPNGAPFTSYPHLIKLLMDKSFRNDQLANIHNGAAEMSHLSAIDREYSLYEIATMTRAAPARILGLSDRGHLNSDAVADIVIYDTLDDKEQMFTKPWRVFKNGEVIVEDGEIVAKSKGKTQTIRPQYDQRIEQKLKEYFDKYQTIRFGNFAIKDDEMAENIGSEITTHPCTCERLV